MNSCVSDLDTSCPFNLCQLIDLLVGKVCYNFFFKMVHYRLESVLSGEHKYMFTDIQSFYFGGILDAYHFSKLDHFLHNWIWLNCHNFVVHGWNLCVTLFLKRRVFQRCRAVQLLLGRASCENLAPLLWWYLKLYM